MQKLSGRRSRDNYSESMSLAVVNLQFSSIADNRNRNYKENGFFKSVNQHYLKSLQHLTILILPMI